MARRQGGLEAPDQKYISPDRKDNLNLPPWHSEGGGMEGSNSFRNPPRVLGFRGGGGVQGLGGGLGGTSGYRAPSGIGGYGGGEFQGGQVGISGAGAGGGGYQGEGGGGGFQAGAGFQTGGFGDPSSRIFTSPGRSKPPKNNSTLNK